MSPGPQRAAPGLFFVAVKSVQEAAARLQRVPCLRPPGDVPGRQWRRPHCEKSRRCSECQGATSGLISRAYAGSIPGTDGACTWNRSFRVASQPRSLEGNLAGDDRMFEQLSEEELAR